VVQAAGTTQPNLVALWHMDETSGTVMRDSARTHSGTLHSVALGQPGFAGTAYGFNGSSSYVSVPSASDLNPGSANITITIRMKASAVPAKPDWDLIRKGYYTTAGGEYKVEYQPTGQATCGFKGSAGYAELTTGPALNDNRWHTIQCVKTSTAIRLIVDGQTFSKTANVGSIANTEPVPIGARLVVGREVREDARVEHRQQSLQLRRVDVLLVLLVVARTAGVPHVLLRHRDDDLVEQRVAESRHLLPGAHAVVRAGVLVEHP
jgi:hypothetical protein